MGDVVAIQFDGDALTHWHVNRVAHAIDSMLVINAPCLNGSAWDRFTIYLGYDSAQVRINYASKVDIFSVHYKQTQIST